ncbi:MAG: PEGA domain-containing protein [Candidatus Omnitrophica bacterium]|jgi:hypothetical protein|nr:PEGA domain-containing protein [Candidatus Omnitrophota bacterium]
MIVFQRIRAVLFYLSILVFFIGLPFILLFALGYKFNPHSLKFTKTGLIFLKTQPEGANIYLNKKLLKEKTPASIQELLPGSYTIRLEMEDYYTWTSPVEVEAGKVSRIDKIILFPLRPEFKQLNQENVSSFRFYAQAGLIYYLDEVELVVYQTDINGNNFQDVAALPENFLNIQDWDVSHDLTKLFLFNNHQVAVISLESPDIYSYSDVPVYLDYPKSKVLKVFWHSDSYHLVVITNKNIEVVEARSQSPRVSLARLKSESLTAFYDQERDMLYFTYPLQDESSGKNNLYKLSISPELYLFDIPLK